MDKPYPGVQGVLDLWVRKGLIDHTHKDALLSEITDDIDKLRADLRENELQNQDLQNAIRDIHDIVDCLSCAHGFQSCIVCEVKAVLGNIKKPKCGLTKPLSTETCILAPGHLYACDFIEKRICEHEWAEVKISSIRGLQKCQKCPEKRMRP